MSRPIPRAHSGGIEIGGPVGVLEAAIDSSVGPAVATAVVCHPHPLQQGAMTNKVVTTVARAFARLGADAVRFNFRGVGKSDGSYAGGIGEADDALAVVAWCRERWPGPMHHHGWLSVVTGRSTNRRATRTSICRSMRRRPSILDNPSMP